MTEQTKKFYEEWSKYGLALIAFPGYLAGEPNEEQKAAANLHIKKSRGLEGMLDDARENGVFDMKKALATDAEQYYQYFNELTVKEALELISKETGYDRGYAPEILKYSKTSLKELSEATKNYKKALEDYAKAKTEAEALKAFKEKQKYEEKAKVYESIRELDIQRLLSYYAKDIAKEAIYIHQRNAYDFDKKKSEEQSYRKAA